VIASREQTLWRRSDVGGPTAWRRACNFGIRSFPSKARPSPGGSCAFRRIQDRQSTRRPRLLRWVGGSFPNGSRMSRWSRIVARKMAIPCAYLLLVSSHAIHRSMARDSQVFSGSVQSLWISLTSCSNRAMCMSPITLKEVANGHREPRSSGRDQAHSQVQKGGIQGRSCSRRGWEGQYRLADGREFKSPSAAGTAITGKACNGWAFWSLEPDGAPAEPLELEGSQDHGEAAEDAETPVQPPSAGFRRVPNQKGVEDGQVRLYCDACKTSFTTPADQQPETCPDCHYPGEASEA